MSIFFSFLFFFKLEMEFKKEKKKKKGLPIDNSIKPLKTYIQVTLQERFKTHKGKEKSLQVQPVTHQVMLG